MPEVYLNLSQKEQTQILRYLSTNKELNRDVLLLEKDIWICWALEFLFKMPNRLPMAFKGGTSLSKVFRIIDRFSEDVDITIDYQAFGCDDPFSSDISKTKLKNISAKIKSRVTQHIQDTIVPYYKKIISEQFKNNPPVVELDEDGETVHLHYPSVVEQRSGYVIDSIRLEFGGRNLTIPNDTHIITADISEYVSNLTFPLARATVLSPQKTFWEKVTLMHYECQRPTIKNDANRISRHWYDVAMLANNVVGIQAITNFELLKEVVKLKQIFYDSSYAKYDLCLSNIPLIPDNDYLKLLKDDFNKMLKNKMFYGDQPNFDDLVEQISYLETKINNCNFC